MALTHRSHNHTSSFSSCCVCCITTRSGSNSTWFTQSNHTLLINRLSLVCQRSSIDFTIVWSLLNSAIASLETLQQESASDFEGKVKQFINKTKTEVNALRCNADSAQSDTGQDEIESEFVLVNIQANEPEKYKKSVCQTFLTEVVMNLHDRFPQVKVLEAFSVFDPQATTGGKFHCHRKAWGLA